MNRMFSDVEMERDVVISIKNSKNQSRNRIIYKLLQDLMQEKACQEHGFYLGITHLKSVTKYELEDNTTHQEQQQQHLRFRVSFTCRTFIPIRGEILEGIVFKVTSIGVFIRCGPLEYAYLSSTKMPNYQFVSEEFLYRKDDLSKIGLGVVVRFAVWAVRFIEMSNSGGKDINVLATLIGNELGPVSLSGYDGPMLL